LLETQNLPAQAADGAGLSTREGEPGPRHPEEPLFSDLLASRPEGARRVWLGLPFSLAVHTIVIALVILLPILWPTPLPEHRDYVRALLYDPPPPPPPPLPKGSGLQPRAAPARPAAPEPEPERRPSFTAPIEVPPKAQAPPADAGALDSDQPGSPTGSDFGVPEGMEGGVEGGVVGGVPGGVLGGVVGGTGDIPVVVRDYDRPPRLIRQTKPQYPHEAFVKKIEGVVVVEILIDANGRVARVRIVQSVPLLDAAALEAVRQWAFEPAIKQGRPVATVANAPVSFRIF
jgi:protein TonB